MATDGVKIIDSDTAHDTYWNIMDMYDSGASIEEIRESFAFPEHSRYSDFDYELYTTSYALAMWEIRGMSEDILKEVKNVINRGACVEGWTREYGEKAGIKRQKELDKLWKKISVPNSKVRKRKKYKPVTTFVYNINDVLSFTLSSNYYVTIVLNINQYRGKCSYYFGKTTYKGKSKPTIEDVQNSEIIGREIPNAGNMDFESIMSMGMDEILKQGGIDEVMRKEAERTGSYDLGMNTMSVEHKDLLKIKNNFELVGSLPLKEVCRHSGLVGFASTFEDLVRDFDDLDGHINIYNSKRFKIEDFIEQ